MNLDTLHSAMALKTGSFILSRVGPSAVKPRFQGSYDSPDQREGPTLISELVLGAWNFLKERTVFPDSLPLPSFKVVDASFAPAFQEGNIHLENSSSF